MPISHYSKNAGSSPDTVLADHFGIAAPSVLVAASDAPAQAIAAADYTCDGENDQVQIQAAIDGLPSTGGIVQLSGGTFTLAAGLSITDDGVALVGAGLATKLISGSAIDLVTFQNVDYWALRDVFIDGSWNGTRGVVLLGARWGNLLNVVGDRFSSPMLDLRADGAATQNTNNNLIQHVHAINCTAFIHLLGDSGNFVTLNTFQNLSAVGAGTAAATLIDLAAYCDTNSFSGITRLNLNFAASVGVVLNSDTPASTREVYGNRFDEVAIDQDVAATVSVQVNNTSSAAGIFANYFAAIRTGGSNPTAPVLAGATSYAVQGLLGTFPTASLPAASSVLPGTTAWDSTTGSIKASNGTVWA